MNGKSLGSAIGQVESLFNKGELDAVDVLIGQIAHSDRAFSNTYGLVANMNEDIAAKAARVINLSGASRGAAMEERKMTMNSLEGMLDPKEKARIASKGGLMNLLKDLDGNELQDAGKVAEVLKKAGVENAESIASSISSDTMMLRASDPENVPLWDESMIASSTEGIARDAENHARIRREANKLILLNRALGGKPSSSPPATK